MALRVHGDWGTPGFLRHPAAELVGPFPGRPFLEAWWRWRGGPEPLLVESESALLALWHGPAGVEFMGEGGLTDYHAPLGTGVEELVAEFIRGLPAGTPFRFDSLPREAAEMISGGLRGAGLAGDPVQHEVAPVIDLPRSHEDFLSRLSARDRHELRRKRRRFEASHGPAGLVRDDGSGLARFAAMHRTSVGRKGAFMDQGVEELFGALLSLEGTVLDFLVGGDGRPLAAGFGFEDSRAYYLYNSAYYPAAAASSPGLVLADMLIERAIETGRSRFDLLKGEEGYKFRLGARPRPLYLLEGSR